MKISHLKALVFSLCLIISLTLAGCGSDSPSAARDTWGQADATELDLNSKIPGRVLTVNVREGDRVEAGQLLATIDARDIDAKRAAAEAQVQAMEAQAEQAYANMEWLRTDLERYRALYEQAAVPAQAYEGYQTKYTVAQATYAQALAGVQAAREQLNQVDVALDETQIRAPFNGVVVTKYVEPGALISTGMPIVALQNPTDNWVKLQIPETEISDYALGDRVTLQGRDGKLEIDGTVTEISQKPDFATARATSERGDAGDIITYTVKIRTDSDQVRPGMRFKIVARK